MEPSAIRVSEVAELPGNLYFCAPPAFQGDIPAEQEAARQKLENFSMILRVAFQKDDPQLFRELFGRLLASAQAAFSPKGFHTEPINDLEPFKREIVQLAGARIKARYIGKLLKTVGIVSGVLLILTAVMHIAANRPEPPFDADKLVMLAHTGALLFASMWGLLFASMTRNIDPTFETLLTPDTDLMEPWFRLLFFGIPVFAIALLFQLEAVSVSIGKVSTTQIGSDYAVAILFGLLLGIAERALPNEVEQWSKRILPSSSAQ